MAAKTLFLLLAATLTQVAFGFKLEESDPSQAVNDWPCPQQNDIKPCVCYRNRDLLSLDCSAVTSDLQLQSAFKAYFPFENFTLLTIIAKPNEKRVPINFLSEDIFQNVTFANIRISHTELSFIHPTVFDKSASHLKTLIVTDSFITLFPFDMVDKAPLLTDLRVFRNEILHLPEMTSDSLTYLHIGYNPGIQFGDHAFEALPNLEYLVANDIALSHVAQNAFIKNKNLKYLDLSHNSIETLYRDSIKFQSPIEEIKLNSNNIHTVEVGAISGMYPSGIVHSTPYLRSMISSQLGDGRLVLPAGTLNFQHWRRKVSHLQLVGL
ncbi:Oplophorus-luciferin 2-monooxygenase non-catalytic subunit [Portunus trituberculatus]|uniref:Oplophorus-luciferin 2-monooxygenase non-catalytic subunit n=1 Tax=Portunus trituberculatus TaxID=210409 RepID=A0A5B7H9J0_PORTR|nr:Oplophorus-luciferin 2-monooxygenase non-catalytic subunit [Portunus trituberculatus]